MFPELERKNLKSLSLIWPFKGKNLSSSPSFFKVIFLEESFWIVSALAFFLIAQLSSLAFYLSFNFLFCTFLCIRFRQIQAIFIWLLMSTLLWGSMSYHTSLEAQEGIYEVATIHSGYSLAKKDSTTLMIYETEWDIGDHIFITEFKKIHSTQNSGLFCFQSFLNQKGIYLSSNEFTRLNSYTPSLKRVLWQWIKYNKAASFYQWLFYGISTLETPLSALGFPMMALTSVLRKILERRFLERTVNVFLLTWQGLLLILFPWRDTNLRLFIVELSRFLFSTWNTRWPFQVFVFLLVNPYGARSMSLVLPAGLSFFTHYQSKPIAKKALQLFWGAFCQIIFMGQLNLILLGGFLGLRTIFGWGILLTLPGLWLNSYGLFLENLFQHFSGSWQWCTITAYPPLWYLIGVGLALWHMAWKYQTQRMILVLGLLCLYPFVWKLDPFFHVYQLDVGQGDAAVVVEPFQKSVVMIDAAGRFNHDNASELYLPFLHSRQIYSLDALIVSHADFDHNGAVESLCAKMPVKTCITTSQEKIPCSYAFELLLPARVLSHEEDENDKSLICAFGYDGFQYLWTGDASSAIEKQLLEHYTLKSDILKLGHHGSNTSSDPSFLRAVDPSLALISSGYQNRYKHPSLDVLVHLNRLGIDRLNTADHGYIHLFSWPHLLGIQTGDGLLGYLFKE